MLDLFGKAEIGKDWLYEAVTAFRQSQFFLPMTLISRIMPRFAAPIPGPRRRKNQEKP